MGISGFEAFVMVPMAPFLLAIQPLRALLVRNQRLLHLVSLAGLLAYLVKTPALRLTTVGFGVFTGSLAWATTLSSDSSQPARIESRILALLAGLLMSVVVKFAWYTNNPLWPIMHAENGGWNGLGFGLGLLSALRYSRSRPFQPQGGGDAGTGRKGSSLLSAFGIGGLFFGLHSLLSDSSTMILWVWDGYPIRGPVANVHAWYTVAAMTGGLVLGVYRPHLAGLWVAFAVGCAGAYLLTMHSHWPGYFGGLVLAAYLMAVAVPLLASAAKRQPAVTLGGGFFVYNIMVLFHVWVVAYAFVPGGPLVRERTDWVMLSLMLLLGAGVLDLKLRQPKSKSSPHQAARRRASSSHGDRRYYLAVLGLLNVAFLSANFVRFPANDYRPYHGADRVLTAGIWTIHFSLDNDMWSSEYRMRDLIRELEIDVVGFLESDCQRIIMGNRDFTQFLAEDLGMYVDYGPGPNKHTWGAALLSKFPILNSTHHLLPSPVGELAPAIHATLDVYGDLVDVFVFHSGQEEDPEDRRLQAEYLAGLMGSSPRPSVLLSYLVTRPLEGNYHTFVSPRSGMHDVDPTDWDRWCEYILYKGLRRTGYARVSRSTITDTELQLAKFVVPRSEERAAVWAADEAVRNRRAQEQDVPEGWRFPALFRGEGVRGHRYHVFDEPRYYI